LKGVTRKIWKTVGAAFCLLFAALLVICAIGLVNIAADLTLLQTVYTLGVPLGAALILAGVAANLIRNAWRKGKCQEEEYDD
jgi:hypothetical protein